MRNRRSTRKIALLGLLAFLLNSTLPFYLSINTSPAAALAGISVGSKTLLCTGRGYQWVDTASFYQNEDVIVIASPLDDIPRFDDITTPSNPQHPDNAHCPLCLINPPQTDTTEAQVQLSYLPALISADKYTEKPQTHSQQNYQQSAHPRAPPHFA